MDEREESELLIGRNLENLEGHADRCDGLIFTERISRHIDYKIRMEHP